MVDARLRFVQPKLRDGVWRQAGAETALSLASLMETRPAWSRPKSPLQVFPRGFRSPNEGVSALRTDERLYYLRAMHAPHSPLDLLDLLDLQLHPTIEALLRQHGTTTIGELLALSAPELESCGISAVELGEIAERIEALRACLPPSPAAPALTPQRETVAQRSYPCLDEVSPLDATSRADPALDARLWRATRALRLERYAGGSFEWGWGLDPRLVPQKQRCVGSGAGLGWLCRHAAELLAARGIDARPVGYTCDEAALTLLLTIDASHAEQAQRLIEGDAPYSAQ